MKTSDLYSFLNCSEYPYEGKQIFGLIKKLFPICRSITGQGLRESLDIIKQELPSLSIIEVPTGSKVFDWEVPKEWVINDAYLEHVATRKRFAEFRHSNLHVINYSEPVDMILPLAEVKKNIHTLPDLPSAIPYKTSYYSPAWGFCIDQKTYLTLPDGDYKVFIDSKKINGSLSFAELIIPGELEEEIFISTYLCHPSMANNELSGPAVATFIAKTLSRIESLKYTYRFVFAPETIGAICYLSKHLEHLRSNVKYAYNLTCLGDDGKFSFMPTRLGNTDNDRITKHVLNEFTGNDYLSYSVLDRGSDERQYGSPGVDLPMCSIMRSKYHQYDYYHTSLDDLAFVTESGLFTTFMFYLKLITVLELNYSPMSQCIGEPMLSKRSLYPSLGGERPGSSIRGLLDILYYCDGCHDCIDISLKTNLSLSDVFDVLLLLNAEELVS